MIEALAAARSALAGTQAWLVGGGIRDRALGRATADVDVVVAGEAQRAARAIAAAAPRAFCFSLSDEFGAWRVQSRDAAWQIDVEPLRAGSLHADLALRDFTVNAIAEPLAGGEPIDPLGGLEDLAARRLRMAGPSAFRDDALRVLRLVRLAVELELEPDEQTLRVASASASALRDVAAERTFAELARILSAPRAVSGVRLMQQVGALAAVLPEVEALRGVEQNRFHHADVYEHTLEVLAQAIELEHAVRRGEQDRGGVIGDYRDEVADVLSRPLGDGLDRAQALRWGALLHDAAKPLTRGQRLGGGVTFIGHDVRGAQLAREVLERLRASERLRAHVASLARNHLRLGFLVHEPQPLARESVYEYMSACAPAEVDVTLLSVADRLATRGERARESIEVHMALAREVLPLALHWSVERARPPLVRGDELAQELDIAPGPLLGELLEAIARARYAHGLATREEAIALARALVRARSHSE
jgi:putative nucleotidyltransferase with HDIG domain